MAKSPKKQREQSAISLAVEFLKYCEAGDHAEEYAKHVIFINGYAYRFDGVLACAYPSQDDIAICPEFEPFNKALKKVGSDFQIQVADDELSVVGKKLKAHVYGLQKNEYVTLPPNMPIYAVDNDKFRKQLAKIVNIAKDGSEHVVTSSILLNGPTATATNRNLIAQVLTGTQADIPLIIPKRTITTLLKTAIPIVSIGYDETSVTFWFENGAFMRSQLYKEGWNIEQAESLLPTNFDDHTSLPREFFEAAETIADLGDTNVLHFTAKGVADLPNDKIASVYKIAFNDKPATLNAELLALVAGHCDKCLIHNTTLQCFPLATFTGEDYRAALAHIMPRHTVQAESPQEEELPQ